MRRKTIPLAQLNLRSNGQDMPATPWINNKSEKPSVLIHRDTPNNNHAMIAITVAAISMLVLIAYIFYRRFGGATKSTPPPVRQGIMRFIEKPPKLAPTVPAITVTMHDTNISRSVTIPSLDFSFLAEYALDCDGSPKSSKDDLTGTGTRSRYQSVLISTAQTFHRLRSSIKPPPKIKISRKELEDCALELQIERSFSSGACTSGRK